MNGKKENKSIFDSRLLIGLFLVALLKPSGFETIPGLAFLDYFFLAVQIIMAFFAIWHYASQPISKLLVITLAIALCFGISTLFNGSIESFSQSDALNVAKVIVALMLVEIYLNKGKARCLLEGCTYGIILLLTLNLLITFIVNPFGLYRDFSEGVYGECFLGNKNTVRNPALLGLACSILLDYLQSCRFSKRTVLLFLLGSVNLVLVWSATATVVFFVVCVLIIVASVGFKTPSATSLALASAITWFVVVVLRKIDFLNSFVVSVLHKEMTFSGRTTIWDCAFDVIQSSPIVGQGFGCKVTYWNYNNPFLQVPHCHNALIDAWYRGGLFAFLLFIGLIVLCCIRLREIPDKFVKAALSIIFAGFLFMGIFGELFNPCFIMLIAMCCKISSTKEFDRK